MAGIGKYKKGVEFTLKSGNSPTFMQMGSSQLKGGSKYDSPGKELTGSLTEEYNPDAPKITASLTEDASTQSDPLSKGAKGSLEADRQLLVDNPDAVVEGEGENQENPKEKGKAGTKFFKVLANMGIGALENAGLLPATDKFKLNPSKHKKEVEDLSISQKLDKLLAIGDKIKK